MVVRWFGQSAFLLSGARTVLIDPFGPAVRDRLAARGLGFRYPPIEGVTADLVLVTHEHGDHNGVEVAGGTPAVIRSTAGRLDSPVGEVIAIASEHDAQAGTARGPNTIFCFALDGLRICHLGDLGQNALRPEQREAIGMVDVLFVPVGGSPTIGADAAVDTVRALTPRLVVPMHYRTAAVDFLEPPDAFLDALDADVVPSAGSEADLEGILGSPAAPVVLLLAAPGSA
jgi:L-ascorbate metabolism protein UlaG (beta-lactamase superfamily)